MTDKLRIVGTRTIDDVEFYMYGSIDEPLYLASDVARALDYNINKTNGKVDVNKLITIVDESERIKRTGIKETGRTVTGWFLTEDGFYECLFRSRKPVALSLKRAVKQILRQIRLTGGFIPTILDDTDTDIMERAIIIAKKTIEKKSILNNVLLE